VHEELVAQGTAISYPALTAFCRCHGIGHAPKPPVGHYDFQPGQEMQHDTSPHRATIGGVERRIETASLVLCYSRMLFFQAHPTFNRFYCKVFLTDALAYLTGAAATCMIDNTHVVVASGTGARMVPAPDMAAFAERFSFTFRAHERGDANRSGRVERPFHFIEHNFLAGRKFTDLVHLNAEARAFCEKVNATYKDHLHASPRELLVAERPHLRPLPIFIPEVYALHQRLVDVEGYVKVHGHRYSVPYLLIGRQLEVRADGGDPLEPADGGLRTCAAFVTLCRRWRDRAACTARGKCARDGADRGTRRRTPIARAGRRNPMSSGRR